MPFDKMTAFTFQFTGQDDTPDWTPTETRTNFDSRGNDLKTFVDALVDAMNSTADGVSGADKLGMTAITGLTGSSPQAIVESLKTYIDTNFYTETETNAGFATKTELHDAVLGNIPNDSLTNAKLGTDVKVGSLATALATDKTSVIAVANDIAGVGRTTETVKGVSDALDAHMAETANYRRVTSMGGMA